MDLGELKSLVKILGVFLDCDFKLDIQINSVIKSIFFQLLTKVKFVLPPKEFQIILHIFVSTHLDYCNGLYIGISQASLSRLQRVQNAAACLLTGTRKREHIGHS